MVLASPDGFSVVATRVRPGAVATGAAPLDDAQLPTSPARASRRSRPTAATMVIPMASGDGVTVLLSLNRPGRAFSNEDLFAVDALSGSSAVALANALRYHRSTRGGDHRRPDRPLQRARAAPPAGRGFARADRATASVSLLLIDFDHFKSVNDELGHQHGDLVLQMGARIVRKRCARAGRGRALRRRRARDHGRRHQRRRRAAAGLPHRRRGSRSRGGHDPRQEPDLQHRRRDLPGRRA